MIFFTHLLITIFLINIRICHSQSNNIKTLEVYSVNNSQILIKYKGRPLYINFSELSDGKTRIHINDIEDDEGIIGIKDGKLNTLSLEKNVDKKISDKYIASSTNIIRNGDNKIESYYLQYVFIGSVIFIIIFLITFYLCWYFYNKHKKIEEKNTNFKKLQSNIKTATTSTISSFRTKENEKNTSISNSSALTLPVSNSEKSSLSSSNSKIPKLKYIKVCEENNTDDTSTLISMKTLPNHKNLSVKSISTFINGLAFFALEATEQEIKNRTSKNSNLQSTQITSKMLTEQYLKSSVPNSKAKVKSSSLKSNITQFVNMGTIKTDDTQDSEEEKNSKSDPPENLSSSSLKSSNIENISSIHPSDFSTQISK